MSSDTTPDAEFAALRERLRRLNEASLHLAEGLEFDRVLQVVADSARELTGAGFGGITVVDERGDLEAFVTSGLTDDERQGLYELPEGVTYFEHLSGLSAPLRVRDLGEYFVSQGLHEFRPTVPISAALFVPIHSRGEIVGNIHLSKDRTQAPFTDEDETTLAMFATQAALAIANARRYRDEQRARADLQILLDTAPVGVLVLDAGLGVMTMANREALRIRDELVGTHLPTLDVPDDLVIRRADGREASLAERPLCELLGAAEIVRAERIVLARPDGASTAMLVNATPIRHDDGSVSSVMVTLQDLTPLEELDRLRADILGMARDELRPPLLSAKGAAATMLASGQTLDPAEADHLAHVVDAEIDRMRTLIGEMCDLAQIHTGTLPLSPAPLDMARLAADAAADLGDEGGSRITVEVEPHAVLVTADPRQIARVLRTMLTDAVASSDESTPVRVSAERDSALATVTVSHRRAEPAAQLAGHLEQRAGDGPGGRTERSRQSVLSLAICRGIVEAHGGRISVHSGDSGETCVSFTVPLAEAAVASGSLEAAPHSAASVLAVDIDLLTQRYLNDALTAAGFELAFARDSQEARHLSHARRPDLVLTGLAHSEVAALDLVRALRVDSAAPVIVVTDHGFDEAALRVIEAGASDYLVKPFTPTELVARIRAALHRGSAPDVAPPPPFVLGELTVDYASRAVTVAGRRMGLTETEYRLLCELTASPGRTLSSDQLMRKVWKKPLAEPAGPVRSVVKRLRRKLGDDARDPSYIITVPRMGYRIATPQPARPTT